MFSVRVLKDERIVVIAEQRPDCAEEEVCLHSCLCLDALSRSIHSVSD